MPSPLSTSLIARLVGPQAFTRGERYARDGHVNGIRWLKNGTQVFGNVSGTRSEPYAATVTLATNARGEVSRVSGVCTCPLKRNCKHVAALLIASQHPSSAEKQSSPDDVSETTDRTGSANAASKPGPSESDEPTSPGWRTVLNRLAAPPVSPPPMRTPLALQLDVPRKAPGFSRHGSGPPTPRLAARLMLAGQQGGWSAGNLNWGMLARSPAFLDPVQVRALQALQALLPARGRHSVAPDEWIYLDGIDSPALWTILRDVVARGVPLISTAPGNDPIEVATAAATVEVDLRRRPEGLHLVTLVRLPGNRIARRTVGFIGAEAHGVFSWDESRAADGTAGNTVRVIAPLAGTANPVLRSIVAAPVLVPAADEPEFIHSFYPQLGGQFTVTSVDGSFTPPPVSVPQLALAITHAPDARITLHWDWRYVVAEPDDEHTDGDCTEDERTTSDHTESEQPNNEHTDGGHALAERVIGWPSAAPTHRHSLWPSAGDTGYRDTAGEAAALQSLAAILAPFPELHPPRYPRARLVEDATLRGTRMLRFLDAVVAQLEASGVWVTVHGDAPGYREADEAPVISLATTGRPEDRDWFNLAVTVSIDGEQIPFDDLFRALATEQDLMILPSGTWFSLDRPELHQLRVLIEEARGLLEKKTDSLRISRFQVDLWDELQALGVVTEQADAWRRAVGGLSGTEEVEHVKLPDTIHASLRDYQQDGFNWLCFLHEHGLGGILADDMGLGKTLQAIALIAHTRNQNEHQEQGAGTPGEHPAPFLVVAPTSVVSNWAAECARFAPTLSVATVGETSKKRSESLAEVARGKDVVITSYTLFRLDFDEYDALDWAGLMLDEAQFVKNHKSRAHLAAKRFAAPFKLAITGTPLENNLMELWSLLSITAPGLFPTPGRFTEYYRKPIEQDANGERLAQLRRRIRPFMLRRTKDEVATDLPQKQEQVLELELNPKHRRVYQMHLQRERQKVLGLLDDLNSNRFEIFRSLTMLRQLSLDASLHDDSYAQIPSTKLDALMEMLEDITAEGHRTLIFSQFTRFLGKVRDRLDAAGVSYSYLDGGTRNRAKTIAEFKDGETQVFLISLKAGGFGLNLTEADYCILLDPWWNPATEAQAVDRAHRIGQTKNVMVYRLVAKDTIEEKVMALKTTKAALFESVMSDKAADSAGFTAADIRALLA